MLKLENCRERQRRMLRCMEEHKLDIVVLANPKTVYYFTGALVDASLPQAFVLTASGKSLLVTNQQPLQAAADRVVTYTGYTPKRVFSRTTMNEELAEHVRQEAGKGAAGVEFEFVPYGLGALFPRAVNITPALSEMRRRKDSDEIECMKRTAALVEAGYAAIKARLEPGMTEYQAHTIIYEAIVNEAQTSVELKGDFACGTRAISGGGPPANRKVQKGDLYILDLFPIYEGYMCDLCRAFCVGKPSQIQQEAWAHVLRAHDIAQKVIRPGATGRAVYEEIRAHLDSFEPAKGSFWHHAGHGVGMDGWEIPWLNPGSDESILDGEIIACEPGLYAEALQGGIRLEHNYLVGKDGVTPLDTFPMDL
jgi:Xaa-Pro aminopeptidase